MVVSIYISHLCVHVFYPLSRVHSNVRVLLTLSSLGKSVRSGCHRWKELFDSIQVYSYLPWERKSLVNVAAYHLEGTLSTVGHTCTMCAAG